MTFRKTPSRGKLLSFLASVPPCVVVVEACASAHYWGREIMKPGHEVRLVPPICAMAIQAFAPPMESFRRGCDFAAWLGLVPRQHSTGGKPRLGRIPKMGQCDLRRLLVCGAMAVVRWAIRRGETTDPRLARMLACKPPKLVAVALANRMARIARALMVNKEVYRAPAAA